MLTSDYKDPFGLYSLDFEISCKPPTAPNPTHMALPNPLISMGKTVWNSLSLSLPQVLPLGGLELFRPTGEQTGQEDHTRDAPHIPSQLHR